MWKLFQRSGTDHPKLNSDLGQLIICFFSPKPQPEIATQQCLCVSSQHLLWANSDFLISCQWSPLSNLVWCKYTHTFTHDTCPWVDWELVRSTCRTQTRYWEAMCPKLDLAESLTFHLKKTLPWTSCACMQHITFLSKTSAKLILTLLEIFASGWNLFTENIKIVHKNTFCLDPVVLIQYWVKAVLKGKSNQDSYRRQSRMFDNKSLKSQSMAVRNVCRSACIMFRWPVADMTVH